MKKRRVLSLLAVMLMVLSSIMTVQAVTPTYVTDATVDTLSTTDIGGTTMVSNAATVTISGVSEATNLDFTTYQVIYATYDSDKNGLTYHLTDWACSALSVIAGSDDEKKAIANIQALYNQTGSTGTVTTEQNDIVNILAAYVTTNASSLADKTWESITNSGNQIWTQNSGFATATLPVGSYLVVPTAENMAFLNMLVSVDATSAGNSTNQWSIAAHGAVLKGNTLGIDKYVEDTDNPATASFNSSKDDAQIGDTISYEVVVDVPRFANNITDITFQVIDTPEHVAINESSVVVVASDSQGNNSSYTLKNDDSGADGSADYSASVGTDGKLTVILSGNYQNVFGANSQVTGLTNTEYPFDKVTITYTATVLSSAKVDEANKNTATLYYGHDLTSYNDGNKISAEAEVYTYELDLTKTNADSQALTGAKFEIVDSTGTAIAFIQDGSTYTVYDNTTSITGSTVTTLTVDSSTGKLVIKGLDSDTEYYIHEVTAPSGYSLNSNYFQIKINATTPGTINATEGVSAKVYNAAPIAGTETTDDAWSASKSTENGYTVTASLKDTKIPGMPSTGSVGIIIFTVLGVCLMIVAVFLMTSSKDKKKQAE